MGLRFDNRMDIFHMRALALKCFSVQQQLELVVPLIVVHTDLQLTMQCHIALPHSV